MRRIIIWTAFIKIVFRFSACPGFLSSGVRDVSPIYDEHSVGVFDDLKYFTLTMSE